MARQPSIANVEKHELSDTGFSDTGFSDPGETLLQETNEEAPGADPLDTDEAAWNEAETERHFEPLAIAPWIAALLVVGWTAFYIFAHLERMAAAPIYTNGPLWTAWIANWAMPVALIIGLWLLIMRTSTRETGRFVDAAAQLSNESLMLEERLVIVNRELSLARDFIASQSRDLESLGRMAAERISGHAEDLQNLVIVNEERASRIGSVTNTAVANLEKLRDDLPVLANAARDMSNQIGNAGNIAQDRLDKLAAGFETLDGYGDAGARHIEQVSASIAAALETFERQASDLGESASAKLSALTEAHEAERTKLAETDAAATAQLYKRAEELSTFLTKRNEAMDSAEAARTTALRERMDVVAREHDEVFARLDDTRAEMIATWEESLIALETHLSQAIAAVSDSDRKAMESARSRLLSLTDEAGRIDQAMQQNARIFDEELARRHLANEERETQAISAMEERLRALDERLTQREQAHLEDIGDLHERGQALGKQIDALESQIGEAQGALGEQAEALARKLTASRALLEDNGAAIADVTDASVRLLELIRSGADHVDGTLATSLGQAEERLQAVRDTSGVVQQLVEQAQTHGEKLAQDLGEAHVAGGASLDVLTALQTQLEDVAVRSQTFAAETRSELQEAINALIASSARAMDDVREGQSGTVREIADGIAQQSNAAISAALAEQSRSVIAEVQEAAEQAQHKGRETVQELRDQLARVHDLIVNFEQRITAAQESAQQRTDHDFSRRMAQITEALNSASIDIAKTFDVDIGDKEWAAYLRGDRGIFTRRAVRLFDKQEAREIHELYDNDPDLRDVINRYIADFETMLRSVLSTRDGNALAVTLLSSDIGKLYVILAQAIERLRD